MQTQPTGICPRCGDANFYTNLACSGCGARLPWANAVDPALRVLPQEVPASGLRWGRVAGAGLAIGLTGGLAYAAAKWLQARQAEEEAGLAPLDDTLPPAPLLDAPAAATEDGI